MRGQTPLADRVELADFYIEQWSPALDLKIVLLTVPALLRGS
jgi:lipopolysaccharide/colanic/teichoic acid biosynthesis glycosyltransferase